MRRPGRQRQDLSRAGSGAGHFARTARLLRAGSAGPAVEGDRQAPREFRSSRGRTRGCRSDRLPTVSPPFVIVDESHHFRRPSIRRYRTLAPWLVGRRVLLLSATPVVNNSQDLYHQLHLALRDDVLADAGQASMRNAFDRDAVPRALGRFAIQRVGTSVGPPRRERVETLDSGAADLLPAIDDLALSSSADIATLVRTGLVQAAASSAAALLAALRRYRSLLRHAQDAAATGAIPTRRELRRLVGDANAQLVLWSLLDLTQEGFGELRVDDLPAVEALINEARRMADAPDAKAVRLAEILRDQVPTLVFVTARESLTYLRRQLPDRWLAWCSGHRAGIGGTDAAATGCAVLVQAGAAGDARPARRTAHPPDHRRLGRGPGLAGGRAGRALRPPVDGGQAGAAQWPGGAAGLAPGGSRDHQVPTRSRV